MLTKNHGNPQIPKGNTFDKQNISKTEYENAEPVWAAAGKQNKRTSSALHDSTVIDSTAVKQSHAVPLRSPADERAACPRTSATLRDSVLTNGIGRSDFQRYMEQMHEERSARFLEAFQVYFLSLSHSVSGIMAAGYAVKRLVQDLFHIGS